MLVGVDESPQSLEAVRQGKLLATGEVTILEIGRGGGHDVLLEVAEDRGQTLIVSGADGRGRMRGIVTRSTATELVHKARCPVLVARTASPRFPERVVVGVDGSPESAVAYALAEQVAERFGADLWPVVAHGAKGVDRELVDEIVQRREDLQDEPVRALVAASADADLLVVGSRSLEGLKSLGSVSERVAHEARCSVLVARGAGLAALLGAASAAISAVRLS